MAELDIPRDVCMVGLGTTAPCFYRIMQPSLQLGCDWAGVNGFPPKLSWVTGSVKGESQMPDLVDNYKVVVLQQPSGDSWEKLIEVMQEQGKKVVFEVDDYLHGVSKKEDHEFAHAFDKRALILFERCMRACDAMICSTEYIAQKYKKYNPNVYVCRNGIDLRRYDLTRPKRKTVNIGWAGATGHTKSLMPWLNQVNAIMAQKPETCFVSIGMPFADALRPYVGEERAISIPWAAIEQYPSAMAMFDIALAPGGGGPWYKGKCIDAATRVPTDKGVIRIGEITSDHLVWDGIQWRRVKAVSREKVRPGLRILTKLGYEIKVTPEHRLRSNDSWKRADIFRTGDSLTLSAFEPTVSEMCSMRSPLLHTGIRSDWEPDVFAESLPRIEIDENWAELIGLFVGDGNINGTAVRISCDEQDMDLVDRIVWLFAQIGLRGIVRGKKTFDGQHVAIKTVTVCSTKLVAMLAQLGLVAGNGSRGICVPEEVWCGPHPVRKAFLRGYFEADGHAGRMPHVEATSKDHAFMSEIQVLLLAFGITSKSDDKHGQGKYKKRTYRTLTLRARESRRFRDKVGFLSKRKSARMESWSDEEGHRTLPIPSKDEIVAIDKCLVEPVDLQVEGERFVAAGIVSHNSDLRWLEASALGIPIIARASIYPEIEDGVTGFHATSPMELAEPLMALIGDAGLRDRVGAAAKEYVSEHRRIEKMAEGWEAALRQIYEQ